jgi:hypothetical protein
VAWFVLACERTLLIAFSLPLPSHRIRELQSHLFPSLARLAGPFSELLLLVICKSVLELGGWSHAASGIEFEITRPMYM